MAFAAVAVATLVAYWLWPLWVQICPANESFDVATCSRQWLAALSGWAAAIGALTAAAMTVPYLRRQAIETTRQADESKRQADFLLGESDPTMDVVEHLEEIGALVVRIANWNRRSIFIHKMRFSDPSLRLKVIRIEVDDTVYVSDLDPKYGFIPPIQIDGWIDRTAQPHSAKIRIVGTIKLNNEIFPEGVWEAAIDWGDETEVFMDIQMIGAQSQIGVLRSRIVTY